MYITLSDYKLKIISNKQDLLYLEKSFYELFKKMP